MPQSLSKVLVHIVFSTKLRFPYLLDTEIRDEMHAYIGGTCNALGCQVLAVGGPADHIHILCLLSRKIAIAKLVEDVKKSSSKWVKTKGMRFAKFRWQNGYGVFSVSDCDAARVKAYIANQEEHHRRKSFEEEYRCVLQEHEVEHDERYVWD